MGLLSRITDWSRPTPTVRLVSESDSGFAARLTKGLEATEIDFDIDSSAPRSTSPVVHFLSTELFSRTPIHRLAGHKSLALNVSAPQANDTSLLQKIGSCPNVVLIADNSATAHEFSNVTCIQPFVISTGIEGESFKPAGVDQRLKIRKQFNISREAICIGVFQPLDETEQSLLVATLKQMQAGLGSICLVTLGSKTKIDRQLRQANIAVFRKRPQSLDELLPCYWGLDMYLSISQIGDPHGILRSWATGIPIVSRPNPFANDLLRDGINSAVAESADPESLTRAACDLHANEEFRHGCSQRGFEAVGEFDWLNVIGQYIAIYQQALGQTKPEAARTAA